MTKLPITNHLKASLTKAKALALELGRNGVDPDLLLYSLLTFPSLGAASIFKEAQFDAKALQSIIVDEIGNKKASKNPSDQLTKKTRDILAVAEQLSLESFQLDYLGPEIVFLCFFSGDFLPKSFQTFFQKETAEEINSSPEVQKLFQSTAMYLKDMDFEESAEDSAPTQEGNFSENYLDMFEENPILSQFAENLNLKAVLGSFEQIVDFDGKINELAAILCRKKKPNAILVGGGGVGKSSIVESLALRIVRGEAPELLANKVIYSLNLSSMVAGTMYRGQFEDRLKNFIDEIKKYNNIILFIDEIHTLVGAGGASASSLEASNTLKPELARGTISCIGATTLNEYTATIKKDAALDRRFERVLVREPSKFIMQQILPTIVSHYEEFHGVKYSQEFTENVVEFCERFLPNKLYPDKAVTVIDHCGAQAKVNFWETDDGIKESHQKILAKIDDSGEIPAALFEELNKRLELWQTKVTQEQPIVGLQHLRDYFETKKNPLASFVICQKVSKFMKNEFVGQKDALKGFFEALNKSTMGLGASNSPAAPDNYLFYGSKDAGKTLLCKTLKNALEKNGASVIYYNGTQLADSYAPYKILSDYGRNTTLCEKVVMNPNCVIIIDDFDEIHFSCLDLFSQILKEGCLQMSNGDVADFSNCKFVFTCSAEESTAMGFNSKKENLGPKLNSKLLALVNNTLRLTQPSIRDLRHIVFNRLKQTRENLKFQNIDFQFNLRFIKNLVDSNKCEGNCVSKINEAVTGVINDISNRILKGETKISLFT